MHVYMRVHVFFCGSLPLTAPLRLPLVCTVARSLLRSLSARSYDSLLSGIHDTTVTAETEVRFKRGAEARD